MRPFLPTFIAVLYYYIFNWNELLCRYFLKLLSAIYYNLSIIVWSVSGVTRRRRKNHRKQERVQGNRETAYDSVFNGERFLFLHSLKVISLDVPQILGELIPL